MKTFHAVNAESFTQNAGSSDANTLVGTLAVTGAITATGGVVGAVTGAVTGDVTGNVTGDVIGASMATAVPAGAGTLVTSKITKAGNTILTQIFVDVQGLGSSTTDLDIIGVGGTAAYIGKILTAESGQVYAGRMTCLEAPTTGVTDIDLYYATEGTGVFDGGVAALAETAIVTSGGAWTLNRTATATGWPVANAYVYLCNGAAGTIGTYAAGQFLIEFLGYEA